ncbi:universal stress protein [Natrarchaeobaculum aegyptiacum]|uniref:Universal stress protein UspA n=1 Tax=Natrarchaeobaculum aegyptiacum TaxID=745377 RepID=A0A2Z2HW25_9EURY|nr:universal stress protein [Natrarchaeobaculum aegyptiacum]ARS89747.1 universal stress protein UspA [Natrarchaeobaculum aegyptiacum]
MADPTPEHVLVPSLGRPGAQAALTYALESFPDADVTLLSVVTPIDDPLSEGGVLEHDEDQLATVRETARELLERAATDVPSATDRVRIQVLEGKPGVVVPRYAREEPVDHVVMYGHQPEVSGYVRRLLGRDVTTTVVERTDEPVTVLSSRAISSR